MKPIAIWNRRGNEFPSNRGGSEVMEILGERVMPGTAFEGEWMRSQGILYVFDVSFMPIFIQDMSHTAVQAQLAELEIREEIRYHYPPAPMKTSKEDILSLPPDDWVLDLKMNGDRVLTFVQPAPNYLARDLRCYTLDVRLNYLSQLVKAWDSPHIQTIPRATANLAQAYEDWKSLPGAEGVVAKKRDSIYQSGSKADIETANWRKYRYEWDRV